MKYTHTALADSVKDFINGRSWEVRTTPFAEQGIVIMVNSLSLSIHGTGSDVVLFCHAADFDIVHSMCCEACHVS